MIELQPIAYAHTRPNTTTPETWDPLEEHLRKTARHAAQLASFFAPKAAHLAGLWHDVGKFRLDFQAYLRTSAAAGYKDESRGRCEHAIVGAYHAYLQSRSDLALVIAAHHGRLHDKTTFVLAEVERAKNIDCRVPSELLTFPPIESPPQDAEALWIRFLFSALVDADSLETEFWDTGLARWRCEQTIPKLLDQLERHIDEQLPKRQPSPIDSLRREVQEWCRQRAADQMGSFRLTVPTGGGKTLSSLLFALHHARHHNLRRVIVVIPYTSIIEQTADTFRGIFGADAVLEHHSNLDPGAEERVNRRCVENWDSPIVVTTSVQFFETLHANHKRDLRKLHCVAESVVILDEVQTFPIALVKPIKDALRRLNCYFKVSTVHCSATQPFLVQPGAAEIIPDPNALFAITRNRVKVTWQVDQPAAWPALAASIRNHPQRQVLAIVHAKKDAIHLANAIGEDCIHLSTLLCPLHRKAVLKEISSRLAMNRPCLVVSTQLVEAGVDVDFPVVYRALGGIDSLAQAAGRCNREARLDGPGEYYVFLAPSQPPPGTPREGTKITSQQIRRRSIDLFDPSEYPRFFNELATRAQGRSEIPPLEDSCNFPEVERLFKMIDDEGTPLIAPYGANWRARVEDCRNNPSHRALRALQPYVVSVRHTLLDRLKASGYLTPLMPDSESAWVVFGNHVTLYSERFGFGGSGSEELPDLQA